MDEKLKEVFSKENYDKEKVFNELYSLLWLDLYKYAAYTLGSHEEAEDAVQDAVALAYDNFEKLKNKEAFKYWVFKILSNCCKRKLRGIIWSRKTTPIYEVFDLHEEDKTSEVMESLDLYNEIMKLKSDERMILNLSIFGGYKSNEISKIVDSPEGTVRSKLHRALKKIKGNIEE